MTDLEVITRLANIRFFMDELVRRALDGRHPNAERAMERIEGEVMPVGEERWDAENEADRFDGGPL